jgi:tRNA pseudouridine55 synthase
MDGIINVYKPLGLTSARTLDHVRRITGQRKSGYAGTLDPAAEGVLVVCLGRATKLVEWLLDQPKVYRATARLDLVSPGFDSEKPPQLIEVGIRPGRADVAAVLTSFEGRIDQVPPALSAVKVAGRAAYRLSRAGRPPMLAARPVHIYWTNLWQYEWPCLGFDVACGRGTYIRALIRDIGTRLGTGGCLTALVRQAVGPFQVQQSWSLARLEAAGEPSAYLTTLETARALVAGPVAAIPPRPAGGSDTLGPDGAARG